MMSNKTIAPTTHNHGDVYQVVVVVVVDDDDELAPPASPDAGASWAKDNRVIKLRNRKQLHAFHPFGISNRFMIYFFKLTIMGPLSVYTILNIIT
jgi:hypothetical protein